MLTVTLTPFQFTPTETWTTAKFNQGFNPTVNVTGSVANADIASGAITAPKVTPDAYAFAEATGTDAYTADFSPTFTAYVDGLQVWVKFANANLTNTPTLDANSLGAKKIFHRGGAVPVAGDIPANSILVLVYNESLDAAAGGWELQSVPPAGTPVLAVARNLITVNNFADDPNNQAAITADEIVLKTAIGGLAYLAANVSLTVDIDVSGVNGLDTGVAAISTWYYLWVIYDPTTETLAGLISLSSTAPTMPAGYTYKALVGVVRNTGTGDFWAWWQHDRRIFHQEMVVFNNQAGNTSNLTTTDISAFVPPIAKGASGTFGRSSAAGAGGGGSQIAGSQVLGIQVHHGAIAAAAANGFLDAAPFDIPILTPSTLYWAGAGSDNNYRVVISAIRI